MNLDQNELPSKGAFVVRWFVETGELGLKIRDKRGILYSICSLYNLLGFATLETITLVF